MVVRQIILFDFCAYHAEIDLYFSIFPSTIYRGNIPKDSDEETEEDG